MVSASDPSVVSVENRVRPRLHLAHVEGLRALAALVVYLNHAYAQSWNPILDQYPKGPLGFFSYSLVAGHFAVSVFIVVSGFCLALPVIDEGDQVRGGAKAFFKRRARRILPPYYAALFLSLFLIWTVIGEPTGSLWDVPIVVDKTAIVSHLLLLQDLFRTGRINYVFWSIAVEWHIYFLFPLLMFAVRRWGVRVTALLALGLGYTVAMVTIGTRIERACPHYFGLFALGMLAAYVVRSPAEPFVKLRERRYWPMLALASFFVVCGLTALFGFHIPHRPIALLDLFVGFFACTFLVHTSTNTTSWARRLCELRPLVAVGTFSYSLYLIHAPLLQLIWQYLLVPLGLGHEATFAFLLTGGLFLVLSAAYGFFLLFEKPFLGRRAPAFQWFRVRSAITQ